MPPRNGIPPLAVRFTRFHTVFSPNVCLQYIFYPSSAVFDRKIVKNRYLNIAVNFILSKFGRIFSSIFQFMTEIPPPRRGFALRAGCLDRPRIPPIHNFFPTKQSKKGFMFIFLRNLCR